MKPVQLSDSAGLTLIELLVALGVFSSVVLAAGAWLTTMTRVLPQAKERARIDRELEGLRTLLMEELTVRTSVGGLDASHGSDDSQLSGQVGSGPRIDSSGALVLSGRSARGGEAFHRLRWSESEARLWWEEVSVALDGSSGEVSRSEPAVQGVRHFEIHHEPTSVWWTLVITGWWGTSTIEWSSP